VKALRNPKDPLRDNPNAQRELFERFSSAANGFPADHVVAAALNILNAIRQAQPSRSKALDAFDELAARTRAVLAEHYGANGERRNIFPFHQVIKPEKFDARPKDLRG
jgi:hypothetical protein